jgi:hypothetical protein
MVEQSEGRARRFSSSGPQNLIPAALSSDENDVYMFVMTATHSGYTVNANPKVFNSSGYRQSPDSRI